jgi:GNAT superfamily N-acetyltransferase
MSHPRLTIREFKPEDREEVYALILSILTTEFKDLPPEHYLADLRDISRIYEGERNEFFVAELDGQIVGTAAVKEEDEKTALLRRLFVHPHMRGKKVGRMLVEKIFSFCKSKGYSKVIFTGNHRMQNAKAILLKLSFKEEEDVLLAGVEIFRLAHKL